MADLKVINVNIGVYDKNNTIAEEIRVRNKMNRTFLANIMASPGAGKTSVLLRTPPSTPKKCALPVSAPSRSTQAANVR